MTVLCLVALTLVCLCLVGQCIGQLGLVTERNNSHHGHQSGSSSWRTKSSHVPQTCNSTIILVAGRSASGSTALTLLQSSSLQYCRGRKEAFRQAPPTERTLQNCIRRSPHGSLLHVKQAHIEGHVIFGKDQPDTLQNSLQFFEAAKRSGYMKVITGYRPNVLDKMISSYELHITDDARDAEKKRDLESWSSWNGIGHHLKSVYTAIFGGDSPPPHTKTDVGKNKFLPVGRRVFESKAAMQHIHGDDVISFDRSYVAAVMAGYDVHYYTFVDVVTKTCETIEQILRNHIGCTEYTRCEESTTHTSGARVHRTQTLAERIGSEAALNITLTLRGSPYEWMLNTSAMEWPEDVVRPLSSMPMPLLSAGGTEEMMAEYNRRFDFYEAYFNGSAAIAAVI